MTKQPIKLYMIFEYKGNYGICDMNATVKAALKFFGKAILSKLSNRSMTYYPYIPRSTFKGWAKRYWGKRLTVKVVGLYFNKEKAHRTYNGLLSRNVFRDNRFIDEGKVWPEYKWEG